MSSMAPERERVYPKYQLNPDAIADKEKLIGLIDKPPNPTALHQENALRRYLSRCPDVSRVEQEAMVVEFNAVGYEQASAILDVLFRGNDWGVGKTNES